MKKGGTTSATGWWYRRVEGQNEGEQVARTPHPPSPVCRRREQCRVLLECRETRRRERKRIFPIRFGRKPPPRRPRNAHRVWRIRRRRWSYTVRLTRKRTNLVTGYFSSDFFFFLLEDVKSRRVDWKKFKKQLKFSVDPFEPKWLTEKFNRA